MNKVLFIFICRRQLVLSANSISLALLGADHLLSILRECSPQAIAGSGIFNLLLAGFEFRLGFYKGKFSFLIYFHYVDFY